MFLQDNAILPERRNWRCWNRIQHGGNRWNVANNIPPCNENTESYCHMRGLNKGLEDRTCLKWWLSFLWATFAPPLSSLFRIYERQILSLSDNTLEHCRSLKPLMLQRISSAGLLFAVRFQEIAIIISRCGYGMKCNIYQGQFINQACLQRQRCGERTMV